MSTQAQIAANRLNAQKSTGPKTAEGKTVVAQNAVKHGLFARENVIKCEKVSDFDEFREELLDGLAPVGGVEAMLAERIVSLSWRLKRVERMNSEAIDVMIAQIETDSWHKERREKDGLLDPETGRSELVLGWVTNRDFCDSDVVLERLLIYEKRIESSFYKAVGELQKLQRIRKKKEEAKTTELEQARPSPSLRDETAAHRGRSWGLPTEDACDTRGQDALATKTAQMKKQTQCRPTAGNTKHEILNPKPACSSVYQDEKTKPNGRPRAGNPTSKL